MERRHYVTRCGNPSQYNALRIGHSMSREKAVRERMVYSRDKSRLSEYDDVVLRKNLYEHRRLDVSKDVDQRARDVVSKGLSYDQRSIVKDFQALRRQRSALDFKQYLQKHSPDNAALKTSRSHAQLSSAISQAKLGFSQMEDKIDVSKLSHKPSESMKRREEERSTGEKTEPIQKTGIVNAMSNDSDANDKLDQTAEHAQRSKEEFINFLSTPKTKSIVLNTRTRIQNEYQPVVKMSSGARPKSSSIPRM